MAKSARQLLKEGKDWRDVGNPQLKQQLRQLQQQNYRQQLNQVNANYQAWRADNTDASGNVAPITDYFAQVNAAKLANQPYTVKDGDNLSTIASATGSTPDAILNANPDVKTVQTGMVLNTPAFQAPAASGGGGIGLPSNAALGATTTNVQGSNYFQSEKFGAPITQSQPPASYNMRPTANPINALSNIWQKIKSYDTGVQQRLMDVNEMTPYKQNTPYPAYSNPITQSAYGARTPAVTSKSTTTPNASTNTPSLIGGLPNAAGISRQRLTASALRLMDKVSDPSYTPTPAEVQALLRHRMLKPNSPMANGGMSGNYSYSAMSYRNRGGSGRGGGGGRIAMPSQPRYNTDDNMPAFSNGASFRALVNWRI